MTVLIFLVGGLTGILAGALLCLRYVRHEVAADIGPGIRRMQLQLDTMQAELNLALATRLGQLSRGYSANPTFPDNQ